MPPLPYPRLKLGSALGQQKMNTELLEMTHGIKATQT